MEARKQSMMYMVSMTIEYAAKLGCETESGHSVIRIKEPEFFGELQKDACNRDL